MGSIKFNGFEFRLKNPTRRLPLTCLMQWTVGLGGAGLSPPTYAIKKKKIAMDYGGHRNYEKDKPQGGLR